LETVSASRYFTSAMRASQTAAPNFVVYNCYGEKNIHEWVAFSR